MEPKPIKTVTEILKKLPGVGQKTAQRYAHSLKNFSEKDLQLLAESLQELKTQLDNCERCFATIQRQQKDRLCKICRDQNRDQKLLAIVEDEQEMEAMEQTNYRGVYFVLGGLIKPRSRQYNNVRTHEFKKRIQSEPPREIILALSPGAEGSATFLQLKKELQQFKTPVTRLGTGLPSEADLRYADKQTLEGALSSRTKL